MNTPTTQPEQEDTDQPPHTESEFIKLIQSSGCIANIYLITGYRKLIATELAQAIQAERERCISIIDDVYDYGIDREKLLEALKEKNA